MGVNRTDLIFIGLAVGSGILCIAMAGTLAARDALLQALALLFSILPQMAGGLLIGGLVKQLVGKDRIADFLSKDVGVRGLIVATVAGVLTPGGPFMSFPIVYSLWTAGAEVGVLVTYITAWALLGFVKTIVWELPLMGGEFTLVRVLVSLPLPILAGIFARRLSRLQMFQLETGDER